MAADENVANSSEEKKVEWRFDHQEQLPHWVSAVKQVLLMLRECSQNSNRHLMNNRDVLIVLQRSFASQYVACCSTTKSMIITLLNSY